ncbi:hypothetical protein [Streptomyces sp. NPDC088254]|uniref:hypothetical protein n=1 Tax=Streptomyces sp. NPDC088254 TaxID=3365847 RepID=UPI00380169F5
MSNSPADHLLAEARRHLAYALRGRPHQPGLDDRIVQAAVDDFTRPVGRGRRMTADLRALYPGDVEDQAVLRPLTRRRSAPQYERARLATGALAARGRAARRAERLGSRPRPYAVAVPAASRSHPRPFRSGPKTPPPALGARVRHWLYDGQVAVDGGAPGSG